MSFHFSVFMVKLKHLFKLILCCHAFLFKVWLHVLYLLFRSSYFIRQVLNLSFIITPLIQLYQSLTSISLFSLKHLNFSKHLLIMFLNFFQLLCHLSDRFFCVLTFLHPLLQFQVLSFVNVELVVRIFKFFLLDSEIVSRVLHLRCTLNSSNLLSWLGACSGGFQGWLLNNVV